jgi:hypothetical protein
MQQAAGRACDLRFQRKEDIEGLATGAAAR